MDDYRDHNCDDNTHKILAVPTLRNIANRGRHRPLSTNPTRVARVPGEFIFNQSQPWRDCRRGVSRTALYKQLKERVKTGSRAVPCIWEVVVPEDVRLVGELLKVAFDTVTAM